MPHTDGLGPVTGRFVRETQSPARTLLGMLILGLILSACVVPGLVRQPWAIALAYAGLLTVIVLLGRRFFRPDRRSWIYVCRDGLAVVDHREQLRDSVRWDEVERADWEWNPHDESSGAGLAGYRLRTRDGRLIRLPMGYDNADDPHAPVGGILRALSATIDGILPRFPTLGESLAAAVVERLARQALDRLAAGQRLAFGRVTVEAAGVTYRKKPALPWAELHGWRVDDGRLRLARRIVVPMTEVEDGWVLVHVLADRAPQPA